MDIQSAISRHGISKAEIARQLESTNSYVTQLTNGQSSPSMKMLDKLASIIGCKRWEFFIDEMDRQEVAQLLGLIVPQEEVPAAELAPQVDTAGEQDSAADAEHQEDNHDQEQHPTEPQEETVQTTLVGLVRCPQCGRAIRLFAEE